MELEYLYSALAALVTSFGITYYFVPAIIRLSKAKGLYDQWDERKNHLEATSPLGGMAIFSGLIISFVFYSASLRNPALNSVLVGLFILFLTGVKDDLYPLQPYKKFFAQLLAVCIVVFQGDVRLESFYGLWDVWTLPYWISAALSVLFFLAIINSFNFIDGINGLSSSIGLVVSLTYAYWFWYFGDTLFLILALSIAGALLAFLRYNLWKAKIFMGDSGSLVLGFFAGLLTINFLKQNELLPNSEMVFLHLAAVVYAFAILIIPATDTLRVVFIRVIIKRSSPFRADRNHIHHALLDIGLTHFKATLTLAATNAGFVAVVWLLNPYLRAKYIFVIIFALALLLSQIPFLIKQKQKSLGRYKPQTTAEKSSA